MNVLKKLDKIKKDDNICDQCDQLKIEIDRIHDCLTDECKRNWELMKENEVLKRALSKYK